MDIQAFKAVKEAASIVALLITPSVLKEIPAANTGCAVSPRLWPKERAVASVPLAFMVVALFIAHFISRVLLTVFVGAFRWP